MPDDIKEKARKAFRLFKDNSSQPSLRIHPIRGTNNPQVFEGYIDIHYRFTFHYDADTIIYRKIGPHSVIDEESP